MRVCVVHAVSDGIFTWIGLPLVGRSRDDEMGCRESNLVVHNMYKWISHE